MSVMEPHTEKLKYIFDNARVGIAICNAEDNTLEMVNPAFAAIHGYEPHELIGVTPGEVFAPECMIRLSEYENGSSCAINDVSFETIHTKKDGSPVPVSVHITVIKDEKGVIKQRIANIIDITERKKTESELQITHERFSQIYDNSIDVIYLIEVTPEGRFIHLDINPAFVAASGMSREEILGSYVDEFENETFRTILLDKYNTCLKAEKRVDYTNDYPLPYGIKTFHSVLTPLFDKNGRIHQIMGIARDITEQKNAEILLRQMIEFNDEIINTIPDLLFELDAEGTYLNIWAQDETLLAAQKANLIGNNVHNILPNDAVEVTYQTMREADISGHSLGNTMYIDLPDGRKWFELSASKKKSTGTYIVLSRDITLRKEQEERLQKTKAKLSAVISTIPDLIWVKDADGVYMMCNPAFENFFGAACGEIIGKTDYDFISKEQADFFRQKDRETMESGKMCINEEEIVFAHNGQRALLETRKIPVYRGEEFMGVLGIGHDITERKKMESEIKKQKDFQNTLLLSIAEAGLGIHVIEEGKYIYTNDIEKAKQYGYDETIMDVKPNFLETIHPDDRAKALDMYTRRLRGEDVPNTYELGVIQTDGIRREHSVSVIVVPNTDPIQTIVVTQDISERKQLEQLMVQNESRLKAAQKIAKVGSWELDFPGLNLSWSDEIYRIFELEPNAFQPSYDYFLSLIHPDDRDYIDTVFVDSLKNKTRYDVVHRLLMSDGRIKYVHERGKTLYNEEGDPIRSIGTVQDITEQKVIEKKIEYMAHHDALTGLPNRTLAKARAEQIIAQAKRSDSKAAFLFIDLDGFKAINDTLGHSVGDLMLKTIASRLKECVRECDIISRQGGDEFLLILSDLKEENVIASTTEKILAELEKSFDTNEHTLSLSGSIGISIYPDHGESFELLLKNADTAMYKAKESGKNGYHFYTQQMTHNIIGQFKIQNDLKMALENNEFTLFYQPQIDLATNRITGVEALIRWFHPKLGMIPPMNFIPIAENSGLIVSIGQWVIEEACRQVALWQKMGIIISVAVNISAMQFKRGNLEEIVKNALHSSKIDPKQLELELTESVIMHNTETTLECVHNLKRLGIQLSIDDFGTGYSSLAYLKRFAVDKLKIDQSFVRDILKDQEDAVIVQTIIQMAKNLNLKSIAEGVENADVLSIINNYGCDEVQGYHFAKPMESSAFETYYHEFYSTN